MLRKSTRNHQFYSHETRKGLDRDKCSPLAFLTTQDRVNACDNCRWIKIGSNMLRKSTRNCWFYSHYIRPARFSTHETREGLKETNVLNSLFLTPQKHRDTCDLRRWIKIGSITIYNNITPGTSSFANSSSSVCWINIKSRRSAAYIVWILNIVSM